MKNHSLSRAERVLVISCITVIVLLVLLLVFLFLSRFWSDSDALAFVGLGAIFLGSILSVAAATVSAQRSVSLIMALGISDKRWARLVKWSPLPWVVISVVFFALDAAMYDATIILPALMAATLGFCHAGLVALLSMRHVNGKLESLSDYL